MHIVKAFKTGNTLCLAIPKVLRDELSIDRTTYFVASSPDTDRIIFTKLTAANLNPTKQLLKKDKINAGNKRSHKKHSD